MVWCCLFLFSFVCDFIGCCYYWCLCVLVLLFAVCLYFRFLLGLLICPSVVLLFVGGLFWVIWISGVFVYTFDFNYLLYLILVFVFSCGVVVLVVFGLFDWFLVFGLICCLCYWLFA